MGLLWSWQSTPSSPRERILPDGSIQLLINVAGEHLHWAEPDGRVHRRPAAMIAGPFDRPFDVLTEDQRDIVGIAFEPGRAWSFLPGSVDALRGDHVSLDDLWGRHATEALREALLAAPTAAARLDVLEAALIDHQHGPVPPDPMIAEGLRRLPSTPRIDTLADELGVSRRRFTQRFRERVGLPPKRWARLQRFHAALARSTESLDLASIALACGYFDQAHFTHDFTAFAGAPPSEVLSRPRHGHHLAL